MAQRSNEDIPAATPLEESLTFDQLRHVAQLLGEAFADSPVYHFIFKDEPDHNRRAEQLAWLLQRNVWIHKPSGCAYVLLKRQLPERLQLRCPNLTADDAVCFFMLVDRSIRPPATTWELIINGILMLPLWFGWGATKRLFEVIDAPKEGQHLWMPGGARFTPGRKHFNLHNMVVHPSLQGCGVGSACLLAAIEAIAKQHNCKRSPMPLTNEQVRQLPGSTSLVFTLSTQEARNVTFYSRLGFQVLAENDFYDSHGEFAYHSWLMDMWAVPNESADWDTGACTLHAL